MTLDFPRSQTWFGSSFVV